MAPDWGPGFKPDTDRPECTLHGEEFLTQVITEDDVGATTCLACAEKRGALTDKGKKELLHRRLRAPMPALTLMQPWATLIARGAKRIETRRWHPRENPGVIAIASSNKKLSRSQREMVQQEPFSSALGEAELPSGVIVAVAVVRAFVRTEAVALDTHAQAERENAFGDFSPGRWAWLLGEVIALSRPIHVKGARGVYKLPRHLTDQDGRPGPLVRAIGGRGEYRRLLEAVS